MTLFLIIVLVVLAVIGLFVFTWRKEQARRAGLAALAQARGWRYSDRNDREVARFFGFLDELSQGDRNRYATDVVEGTWQGWRMMAFNHHGQDIDYDYDPDGGRDRDVTTYWHAVVAFQLPIDRPLPELRVAPEGFFSRLADRFTNRDIDFPDAPAFSEAFVVHADDLRLATDVCNPQMIQYLLQHPDTDFEIEGQWMATVRRGRFDDQTLDRRLDELTAIAERLPAHLTPRRLG